MKLIMELKSEKDVNFVASNLEAAGVHTVAMKMNGGLRLQAETEGRFFPILTVSKDCPGLQDVKPLNGFSGGGSKSNRCVIVITCDSEAKCHDLASLIHTSLVGNTHYFNKGIVLNYAEKTVTLTVREDTGYFAKVIVI